jgi:hypothetical protein
MAYTEKCVLLVKISQNWSASLERPCIYSLHIKLCANEILIFIIWSHIFITLQFLHIKLQLVGLCNLMFYVYILKKHLELA